MNTLKEVVTIDKWSVVLSGDDYTPPECRYQQLHGLAIDHPRLGNRIVTTSRIVGRSKDSVVTRSGTRYQLGEPFEEYASKYPNAKERLLSSLAEV